MDDVEALKDRVLSSTDHYTTLGVSRDFDANDLKREYKRLALLLHPDKSGGDPEVFGKISAAYDALKDAQSRRAYDALLGAQRFNAYAQQQQDDDESTRKLREIEERIKAQKELLEKAERQMKYSCPPPTSRFSSAAYASRFTPTSATASWGATPANYKAPDMTYKSSYKPPQRTHLSEPPATSLPSQSEPAASLPAGESQTGAAPDEEPEDEAPEAKDEEMPGVVEEAAAAECSECAGTGRRHPRVMRYDDGFVECTACKGSSDAAGCSDCACVSVLPDDAASSCLERDLSTHEKVLRGDFLRKFTGGV